MTRASKYDWLPALIALDKAGIDHTTVVARECARSWVAYHVAAALFVVLTGAALWAAL